MLQQYLRSRELEQNNADVNVFSSSHCRRYLLTDAHALECRAPNTTPWDLASWNCLTCLFPPILGHFIFRACTTQVEVPKGNVALLKDGRGGFEFAGPGLHLIKDPFYSVESRTVSISQAAIQHGDRGLVCIHPVRHTYH